MANVIIGTGSYLPECVVTNDDIEAAGVDFDRRAARGASLDEWARRKHGGVTRCKAAAGEGTSDMATVAARRALADAAPRLRNGGVDLIVLATFTSDYRFPQAAALIQTNLGSQAKFIQVDAGCSGFVDALLVAHAMMDAHGYDNALVIGADTASAVTDPQRFMPLTIFGDGAGAVVLQRESLVSDCGVRTFSSGSDGALADFVSLLGGGSKIPLSEVTLEPRLQYLSLKFADIRTWAVDRMIRGTREAIERAGIAIGDVAWVVPHQASSSIIEEVAQRLELPLDMFVVTYPRTGNTSAASIPIALDYANNQRMFAHGDWIVMPAAGAGMAWGAVTYRWYDYHEHTRILRAALSA
jgi:3-oxoacyl-[acyl-carrier-protein] synthase-3